jgi:hypothetical protein
MLFIVYINMYKAVYINIYEIKMHVQVKICGGIPIVITSKPENNYIFTRIYIYTYIFMYILIFDEILSVLVYI